MAEPVGDLVVDLSLDAARFDEQMARVRRHFSGTETDAKKTAAVVEQSLSRQALAAQKAGISVGQYKAAMRMLPAQFTDVATQLAGGQSPWLILLQQGGQVKDSFGGMIPMFRGLAGAITLPMVGATSLAVATGALAYAWYQGNSTLSDFNKTLVLSGNQAGLTADRILALSRAGQAAGLTFNQTSESLTALVNAGVRGGEQFEAISQSVARFSSASGVEVDKVAEAFGKLTTDPTSGLTAMARQFHNVTAEQIAYVAQLQRSGDEAGALQAANEAATKGFDEPEAYFRMSPEDWLRAEMQGEIVALVHSHPGGLPWLSEADRRLQVQSDLPWWLVCRGTIHKFRCVPHLTGRRFEHGVTDCYTLFRDAYHLAGIEMPDFHREDDWWRNGQNLYLDNLEATGLYQVPLSSAQPGDVLLCCFGSSVPNHAAIYCGDGELLHHIPEQLSKRERYTDKWQRRTHSLWRHRAWRASAFTGIYNDLAAASTFV